MFSRILPNKCTEITNNESFIIFLQKIFWKKIIAQKHYYCVKKEEN